jgi:hypothetical protein
MPQPKSSEIISLFFFVQCWGSNPGPSHARLVLYHWASDLSTF